MASRMVVKGCEIMMVGSRHFSFALIGNLMIVLMMVGWGCVMPVSVMVSRCVMMVRDVCENMFRIF